MDEKTNTTTYRRPLTEEAREHRNTYHREYNKRNPERVKQWRLNQARKLLEAAATVDAIPDGQDGDQHDQQEGGAEE